MDDDAGPMRPVLAGVLLLIVAGGVVDLLLDAPEDWRSGHVLYELGLILGGVAGAIWLWRKWRRAEGSATVLRRSLEERQRERDAWRERAGQSLRGLGEAVADQFERWGLTPAEREVAFLLLKGLSHKEIAAATGRSERTVRQHGVNAYQKAGVSGRAELAAYFFGDLGLPSEGGSRV